MSLQQDSSSNTNSDIPVILLVGKSGAGKSTLGNLLLGRNEFAVSDSAESSLQVCQTALIEINNKTFNLIDTPGIFDTGKTDQEILKETGQAILQCVYGIQAIIFVMEATRFTKEQRDTINQIEKYLGPDSLNHMIAVFSKCRKAPTIDPDLLFNSLAQEQKDFLNSIDNRFTISPNLEIFEEPDDPIVARHIKNLKNYIADIPNFYTTASFEKVCMEIERRHLEETRENTKKNSQQSRAIAGYNNMVREAAGCFAAHSKVTLQNGNVANISELVIGDYVCCGFENGKQIFSEVFLFIHADHDAVTEFLLIDFMKQDGTQGTFCVTPEHHIFLNDGGTDFAKNIIPNKTQFFISSREKLIPVTSTRITKERKKGYYSPLTRSGTILVDEILCSCYSSAPPYQALFNFVFAPLKIYTKIFPSNYLDKEIHPYVKFLNRGRKIVEFLDYLNIPRSL
ncbi:uncharacterized protein OCT59_025893 [Rhizophagus irregularis]|uniref:AIG1-type G domain-containing protein n=2 Tax=Rhizophagus irregularis TaxID=588596 RepID=U9UTC4_RHIID|nr:hypothetical protein GLOIN_2v1579354 [Rhizophagus irregularis DAOM 181602=DAOM 197198]EXX58987.1 hypothetical protein RirG_192860 [Rhizophagus irregularis DAOM 197198w]UZO05545.1 hypothetical protein OCT59_025893 [Rhizophagus irregularis]POG74091.1 hypothetical protein GLOIN_2v1579354 [Rhizophagus irregularis DAOM 181602=DAOM 197198]CAG8566597.1 22043_t:CDS:2 [Rhizophagus irregularis]GBC12428.1 hypothetical protein GLOIN_2v1579354 [Rhizophagus irregularis DAOM 181602=DAOM 197198]|eukprot:XP_025180957.1 hypothetical protein GLOIN_2v1579354 [Rhizophagus irregularis DAOM 181602=DAOM 197198]